MGVRFSIVYPTRDRPSFVRQALRILERQRHDDFEVIVCDNFLDPTMSCEEICRASSLANVRYVRPPEPLGMVENWNHALQFATGEYVAYLTDKMFVLPDALGIAERAVIAASRPEIVTWTSDAYNPASFRDYFGRGTYVPVRSEAIAPGAESFQRFSPADELDRRGRAASSRGEQSSADYARGKLVFGAYRRELLERIANRYGAVFRSINPDYTSMILGLTEANAGIELSMSCVVSMNTDISNGRMSDTSDSAALTFLDSLEGGSARIVTDMLVPGLYVSLHNWVAHDFLSLKGEFGLTFEFDVPSWLVYITEDVNRSNREWSDLRIERQQKAILAEFFAALEPSVAADVQARIEVRAAARQQRPPVRATVRDAWLNFTRSRDPSLEAAIERVSAGRHRSIEAPV